MGEFGATEIIKRLDIIISLLLQAGERSGKKLTLRDQISLLSDLGVRPVEIASILGKKPTFVNKELSIVRKS
jgi:hypothetical protein